MRTFNTARRSSQSLIPSSTTVQLWLIPSLVIGRNPAIYEMSVLYVKPAQAEIPLNVDPFVRLWLETGKSVMLPTNQSLAGRRWAEDVTIGFLAPS
jgi:hypothetical protein